jgi:triacylglycerol lipase
MIFKNFLAYLLLFLGAFLSLIEDFAICSFAFAWIGGIQILNSVAPRLPFSRLIHWFHAITFEILALLGLVFMRLIPHSKKRPGTDRPILLVHGYAHNSSIWAIQKKRLEEKGLGPVYTIDLGYPFHSIPAYAEHVKTKVELIAKETARNDLILIGHSMGGLVSAWYSTHLAPVDTVTDVITIGSPLGGTIMAWFAPGPNAKQMYPDSDFVQQLQVSMAQAKKVRFFHIGSKSDEIVIPASSSIVDAKPYFIIEDLGHASLLYSDRVTNKICSWLGKT